MVYEQLRGRTGHFTMRFFTSHNHSLNRLDLLKTCIAVYAILGKAVQKWGVYTYKLIPIVYGLSWPFFFCITPLLSQHLLSCLSLISHLYLGDPLNTQYYLEFIYRSLCQVGIINIFPNKRVMMLWYQDTASKIAD